jgi:hypothetical protein
MTNFWNGGGYEWLSGLVGNNLAAILVVLVAALYCVDYTYFRKSRLRNGQLDIEAKSNQQPENPTTTDINYLRKTSK